MTVLTADGCSLTITGELATYQTRDGSWLVQVGPNGCQVTDHNGGAAINVRGTNEIDVHTQTLSLPLTANAADAIVVMLPGSGRAGYWSAQARSACINAMAVVFVSYPVTGVPALLRPPAIGNSWMARYLRSAPIYETQVNMSLLPSIVNVATLPVSWGTFGKAEPTIAYLTALFAKFSGECYSGWSTDTRTPDRQHPGYGSDLASVVSQSLVQLCSLSSTATKTPLAMALVQWGLDLAGAFSDGRTGTPNGGHMAGRKALIVLAGHLLGVEQIANPTAALGPVFHEDIRYAAGNWWSQSGWSARWKFQTNYPYDGTMLGRSPATWGDVNAAGHDTWAWAFNGYFGQTVGAQIGTALGMRLLGRSAAMGANFDGMIDQFMGPVRSQMITDLSAVGISIPWGTDYAIDRGLDFCMKAWLAYA